MKKHAIRSTLVTMFKQVSLAGLFLSFLSVGSVFSQTATPYYPPTIKVDVTFYDFRSNGSNPEFECPNDGRRHYGMLDSSRLTANRKPILGSRPYLNCGIDHWFNEYVKGKGDSLVHLTNSDGTCNGTRKVMTDSSYMNIKIDTFLIFTAKPGFPGVYEYVNDQFFPLDNKGYGKEGKDHNYGFTMEMHYRFKKAPGLTFNFAGDDDVWAFINNRMAMDIGGLHLRIADNFQVDNLTPKLVDGQAYNFDLFYAERHSVESHIAITTNLIGALPRELVMAPHIDTVASGASLPITATVMDDTGAARTDLAGNITWKLEALGAPTNTSSSLKATTGGTNVFYAGESYRWVDIIGKYQDPSNTNIIFYDTTKIWVQPGPEYKVWIEADTLINTKDTSLASLTRLRQPVHYPLVTIENTQTTAAVYSVIRDSMGGFIRLATTSTWSALHPNGDVASAAAGTVPYQGIATRLKNGDDSMKVTATDISKTKDLLFDVTGVRVTNAFIDSLKFVDAITGKDLPSINITTDMELTIKVMGKYSTDLTTWVPVNVILDLTPTIPSEVPVPTGKTGTWRFSPTAPGTSALTGTTDGVGAFARSHSIPVIVTVASPTKATFEIITPADKRIAGDTILGVVKIFNKDGLIPGTYCYTSDTSAVYQDSLGQGSVISWDPKVITTEDSSIINQIPSTARKVAECFNGGIDTMKFVLYRAPYTDPASGKIDTLHTLSVILGNIGAIASPFKLLPAKLNALQLESPTGLHYVTEQTLKYPNDAISVLSIGYDKFGNKRGPEVSNWSVTENLHALSASANISRIFYETNEIKSNESGLLIAVAVVDTTVSDNVALKLLGPASQLKSAVTRDYTGNGLLDAIELTFDKAVTLPATFASGNYTVIYNAKPFTVTSIDSVEGSAGTKFVLNLTEVKTTDPQTAWTPELTISGIPGINDVKMITTDGAGPVIWSVTKEITNITKRELDIVTVTFSEPIQSENGGEFKYKSVKPTDVLNVYIKNENGTYSQINALDPTDSSITSFATFNDAKDVVTFTMKNGKDLTSQDYINIKDTSKIVWDKPKAGGSGVLPNANNQKVQVIVKPVPTKQIIAVPNPSTPTFIHEAQGVFTFKNNRDARNWVRLEGKGTVVTFKLALPQLDGDLINANIRIYDVIGNVVNEADTVIAYDAKQNSSVIDYDLYWNGSNKEKMKVAPGVYRAAVTLLYKKASPPATDVRKLWGTIGIK